MRRLDYKDFEKIVTNQILEYLPYEFEGAEVKISPMKKLGASYTALSVIRGTNSACPAVNMDQFYDQYLNGKELSEILPEMSRIIRDNQLNIEIDWVNNYEKVREKLFIRVSNADQNRELLKSVPHELVNDFAITCHLMVGQTYGSIQSAIIYNELMNSYGVTEKELLKDAKENSQKLFPMKVQTIQEAIGFLGGESVPVHSMVPMVIVTNEQSINGASSFFYPEAMEEISKKMGGDYYMIPSSIHEVIIVPAKEGIDTDNLKDTLHFVNDSMVEPSEQLGSEIYMYNAKEHVLSRNIPQSIELDHNMIPDYMSLENRP